VQDIGAKSKDFNNLSGKYTMELIVGDAVIENPITWLMVREQSAVCDVHCFSVNFNDILLITSSHSVCNLYI